MPIILRRGDVLDQKAAEQVRQMKKEGYKREVDPVTGNYRIVDKDGSPTYVGHAGVPVDKKGRVFYKGRRYDKALHKYIGELDVYKPNKKKDDDTKPKDQNDENLDNKKENGEGENPDEKKVEEGGENPDEKKVEEGGENPDEKKEEDNKKKEGEGEPGQTEYPSEPIDGGQGQGQGQGPGQPQPGAVNTTDWTPPMGFWDTMTGEWINTGPEGSVMDTVGDVVKAGAFPITGLTGWSKYWMDYPSRNYDMGWGDFLFATPEQKKKAAQEVQRKTQQWNQTHGIKKRGGKLVPRNTNKYGRRY